MILCVGEILADMIGEEKKEGFFFERKAGGAPFNVACAVKRLGGSAGFAGSVGDDLIGDYLLDFAERQNFDALILKKNKYRNTTLAFVQLSEAGERQFCFYRKHTADYVLPVVPDRTLQASDIVHIGSLMLSEREGHDYAETLAKRAKTLGKTVSFDVNFRCDIFRDSAVAVEIYRKFLPLCDIVKFSEEEAEIFGDAYLRESLSSALVCITKGTNGSEWRYAGESNTVETLKVSPVDTTGAGDAFFGGVLFKIGSLHKDLQPADLNETLAFGNACGALNTLGRGAIDPLPTEETVKKFIRQGLRK